MPTASPATYYKESISNAFGSLVGKTVLRVRPFVPSEYEMFGWSEGHAFLIEFDDNTLLIPVSDEECNSAGWLYIDEL